MSNNSESSHITPQTTASTAKPTATPDHDENRWVARFEEILKVKNMDDLKTEFGKIAGEIQTEIQAFDLNAHLSPEAKSRLKILEQRYNQLTRQIQKAQKQFDREFNKSLRVLKRTKQDAEKHLQNIRTKITKHRGTLIQASEKLRDRLQKKTKSIKKKTARTAKKVTRKKS